eukprot:352341-Pelagomonas_calceolata.AAC.1
MMFVNVGTRILLKYKLWSRAVPVHLQISTRGPACSPPNSPPPQPHQCWSSILHIATSGLLQSQGSNKTAAIVGRTQQAAQDWSPTLCITTFRLLQSPRLSRTAARAGRIQQATVL